MKEDNVIVDKSKAFALKEASETEYWLELLVESDYIEKIHFNSMYFDCKEILKILMSITKTQNDIKRSETE
ncbi:MAG: four helix bundle protein [Oscillospiraceae bacterium]|nr:four helix bundle protein [Oscillospiraceae bacterium]